MELEELKTNWLVLNERLAKNEILNKRIIKEMITKRTRSAYNRLFGYNVLGLVLVSATAIGIFLLGLINFTPLSIVVVGETGLILSIIWVIIRIIIINRFQFDSKETVYELLVRVLKFKLLQKKEFIISLIFGGIILGIIVFSCYSDLPIYIPIYIRVIIFLSVAIFTFVLSYVSYLCEKRNVEAIGKGLDELKELEEEMEK
ncbi:MAG: hypothetical protein LBT48_03210 [Prevotellaceae bacterium]|jgi:hypothetical protein|nr:hypothetical protein [Prevotellaceae bacterium]